MVSNVTDNQTGLLLLSPLHARLISLFLGSTASGLVFLSRVTDDLASASLFVENIACSHHAGQGGLFSHLEWSLLKPSPLEFNSKLALLNAKIIHKWRETIVAQIVRDSHFLRGKHPSQSGGGFDFVIFAIYIHLRSIDQHRLDRLPSLFNHYCLYLIQQVDWELHVIQLGKKLSCRIPSDCSLLLG